MIFPITPFAETTSIVVVRFLQSPPVRTSPAVYAEYKNTCQKIDSLWDLCKIGELTEVTSQLEFNNLLSYVWISELYHDIVVFKSWSVGPSDTYPKGALHKYRIGNITKTYVGFDDCDAGLNGISQDTFDAQNSWITIERTKVNIGIRTNKDTSSVINRTQFLLMLACGCT